MEGCEREHTRDRLRFLITSRASLAEVGYCLHVAKRLGYIAERDYEEFDRAVRGVGAPLSGLITSVREGRMP